MSNHSLIGVLAALLLLSGRASAQDQAATIMTAASEEHGTHLTDAEGRAVYLFVADTQGEGNTAAVTTCFDNCLAVWPALITEGDPQAGEGVAAEMLGTITRDDGTLQVTYNGWPLYYFVGDAEPGETKGHGIEESGAEWYLLTPEGEKAGGEEHEADADS